jgi:hypothetical protein
MWKIIDVNIEPQELDIEARRKGNLRSYTYVGLQHFKGLVNLFSL